MAVTLNYIVPPTGATPPTTANFSGALMIVDVAASADGDTTATIPHLMGAAPKMAWGQQLVSQALTALSAWSIAIPGSTNVVATKLASTGSGGAPAQYRVFIMAPHTIIF